MRPFIGAKELGLTIRWRLGFIGVGETVETTPGVIYLDVGNAVQPGVLDHHSLVDRQRCTADLVFDRRELVYNHLMAQWLELGAADRIPKGTEWPIILITHQAPDWDSVVSSFLAMHLVENGDFPGAAEGLVAYAREVDQGRWKLEDPAREIFSPHIAYLAIQNLRAQSGKRLSDELQLLRGHELVRRVLSDIQTARGRQAIDSLRESSDFHPARPGAADWKDDPRFSDALDLLQHEPAKFERDLQKAKKAQVWLPDLEGGEPLQVPCLIAHQPTESILNKYWVRQSGFPFFICPYHGRADAHSRDDSEETVFPRVVLSLDPNFSVEGRRPTLRGLGYALEKQEVQHRRSAFGVDDRGGVPRFPDGYCTNDDPWYDGRAFQWTIVDAPRSGTKIPYQEIVRIATAGKFWEIPIERASLSLVWVGRRKWDQAGAFQPMTLATGMEPCLKSWLAESNEAPCHSPLTPGQSELTVSAVIHTFPRGTCRAVYVATVESNSGTTLERLAQARADLAQKIGGTGPAYALAKLSPGRHFSGPERVHRLLNVLADEILTQLEGSAGKDGQIMMGGQSLIVCRESDARDCVERESELQLLLYLVFLKETLQSFSSKISDLLPGDERLLESLETETLRRDFLCFQTRYYQIEASRSPRGRLIQRRLWESMAIGEHYKQVQSELDYLAQLENQIAEERQSRSERLLELALYVIAVFGVAQFVMALYELDEATARNPSLWLSLAATFLIAFGFMLWLNRRRQKKQSMASRETDR